MSPWPDLAQSIWPIFLLYETKTSKNYCTKIILTLKKQFLEHIFYTEILFSSNPANISNILSEHVHILMFFLCVE